MTELSPDRTHPDGKCPPEADNGHLWLVSVKSLASSWIVTGDAHHHDTPPFPNERSYGARVRAWSLSEAVEVAGRLEFIDWMSRDEEGRFCGMVNADASTAPIPDGKVGYCGPRCQHCMGEDGRPMFGLNSDGVWACAADADYHDGPDA